VAAGLPLPAPARDEVGLAIVTEVTNPADVPVFEDHVDMIQVGARNMQNFVLLKAVGRSRLPVLLKRGLSATIEELLMAAEYILAAGNPNVVLCERGIRSFDPSTRNILDLAAVPVLRERTHLPVIVDPSHATGHRPLVRPMAVAGAAAGADGLIIEVHPNPPQALSDSEQSLSFPEFGDLMDDLRRPAAATTPAATAIVPGDLERLRGRIDDVDARLAALVEERAQLAVAVQQTRKDTDHGHDVGRERALIERAVAGGDDSVLLPEEREQVFSAIVRAARSAQRRQAALTAAAAAAPEGTEAAEVPAGSAA
jgi:3-deoxy-7-phosphoheptulonate synthase